MKIRFISEKSEKENDALNANKRDNVHSIEKKDETYVIVIKETKKGFLTAKFIDAYKLIGISGVKDEIRRIKKFNAANTLEHKKILAIFNAYDSEAIY